MNIAQVLHEQARRQPDVIAIHEGRGGRLRAVTFAELERETARAAGLLAGGGLRPGDAVLIFQPMSVKLYVALIAVFRLGLIAMFLDPSAGRAHLERCCALYPPKGLIASAKAHLLRLVSPALRRIPDKYAIGMPMPGARRWCGRQHAPLHTGIEPCAEDTPALLTFTSGSTGEPKAALRTHGFLLAQHAVLRHSLALTPGEVDLATLPIFVLANLATGVTSVIPDADLRRPGAVDPAPVWRQIRTYRPNRTAASPAFYERLADYGEARGEMLESIERIYTGGAPVFPTLLQRLQRLAPRATVTAVYGSTEAEPIAHIHWGEISEGEIGDMMAGKGLLTGTPVPEIELRILPDRWGRPIGPFDSSSFEADFAPPGEAGEIVVSGRHVLPGYLHGRGDEETKFEVDGRRWHRTGDAGYLDHRGRLWLLGRCAARVADARGVLYPFSVECAAMSREGVHRAALIVDDGHRILALEPARGRRPDIEGLRRLLAWAQLDEIRIVATLPMDRRHNAKVDYPALRTLLERQGGKR